MRVWIPWYMWLVIIPIAITSYFVWAVIAAGVFVVVSLIAMAVTRSWRRGLRIGGLTFVTMMAPRQMNERFNRRNRIHNVRVVA